MSMVETLKRSAAAGPTGSVVVFSALVLAIATGTSVSPVPVTAAGAAEVENSTASPLPAPLQDNDFLYDGAPDAALFELGRNLFFDPILSGNHNISCGTCHDPARGTSDGVALSIGEGGAGFGPDRRTEDGVTERIPRNAQALWNIGAREYRSMFHDGRVETDPQGTFQSGFWSPGREHLPPGLDNLLAAQAMFPVLSPSEMAGQKGENPVATAVAEDRITDAWDILAARLAETPAYQAMFKAAFPNTAQITLVQAANALAAFQTRAFRSDSSSFDAFLKGQHRALNDQERAGAALFFGEAGCVTCHSGALLSDHDFHAIAVPQIGPGKGHGGDTSYWRASGFGTHTEDEGRYRVTFEADDLFAFRTPSLRNVALTGPWGHDGAFDDLERMVRHHLDTVASLEVFEAQAVHLPRLEKIIEQTGDGSELIFRPLNPKRREAFDLRDGWVQSAPDLRQRIARANTLAPTILDDHQLAEIVAFLNSLSDPTAMDRSDLIPHVLPSGLAPQPAVPNPDG